MGKIIPAAKHKLVIGFIGRPEIMEKARVRLCRKFGLVDYTSDILDFEFTDYYAAEMGRGLKRRFISFKRLVPQDALAGIKIFTNHLEKKYAVKTRRQINIDPGMVSLGKLILATTKDYSHRVYIGQGIYSEVTLRFKGKTFMPWEWTYPDYGSAAYINIFNQIREIYQRQINEINET